MTYLLAEAVIMFDMVQNGQRANRLLCLEKKEKHCVEGFFLEGKERNKNTPKFCFVFLQRGHTAGLANK